MSLMPSSHSIHLHRSSCLVPDSRLLVARICARRGSRRRQQSGHAGARARAADPRRSRRSRSRPNIRGPRPTAITSRLWRCSPRAECTSRREEFAEALRCYQRALRYDPQSAAIARAIVPVAVQLERYAEAARYALKAERLGRRRSLAAGQAGRLSGRRGRLAEAVALYEKAVAARRQSQANRRRRPPADGVGPALLHDREIQAGGRVLRRA